MEEKNKKKVKTLVNILIFNLLLPIFCGIMGDIIYMYFLDADISIDINNVTEETIIIVEFIDSAYKKTNNILRKLWDFLFILSPLLISDLVREWKDNSKQTINREHFIDKSLNNGDDIIGLALSHISNECYNLCQHESKSCKDCHNNNSCCGLLRHYMHESTKNLKTIFDNYKNGYFDLNTNIEKFHTMAIDHLYGYKCKHYSVVHYLTPNSSNNTKGNYDEWDFDFLRTMLQRSLDHNQRTRVKIRWLFVGDYNDMKNNYDYIPYVIEEVIEKKKIPESKVSDYVSSLIEFKYISNDKYLTHKSQVPLSDFSKQTIFNDTPSVGIFGDYFIFVDDDKTGNHGTIFTNQYNGKGFTGVNEVVKYFDTLYKDGVDLKYSSTIRSMYQTLIDPGPNNENNWKETLKNRDMIKHR